MATGHLPYSFPYSDRLSGGDEGGSGATDLQEKLAKGLLQAHPADAASVLENLPEETALAVLGRAKAPVAAEVLRRFAPMRASAALAALAPEQAARVLEHLDIDLAANLMRRLTEGAREQLLEALRDDRARELRPLLRFAEGTAGALMDPHVLALPEDETVQRALKRIRETPEHVRYNIYVVDRAHVLVGVLNLRELLLGRPRALLSAIANRRVLSVRAEADRGSVLSHPAWREAHSLPVVDEQGVYLGAVRYRTLRLLEEEFRRGRPDTEVSTARALGELFWTGMAGMLGAASAALDRPEPGVSPASEQHEV